MAHPKEHQKWTDLVGPDQPSQEGPGKWEKTVAALAGLGGVAAGTAIEKGFEGSGEFVSRLFGLPEHPGHPSAGPEREPAQEQAREQDKDRGLDR